MNKYLHATSIQFEKVILRMMPECFSSMPEGKLIAAIYGQAFTDAHKDSSRRFFLNDKGMNAFYCAQVGLEPTQIKTMFTQHCKAYKAHLGEIAAWPA